MKIKQITPILEKVKSTNTPLFIIAKHISEDVLSTLIYNNNKGIIENCAITVPGMGEYPDQLLADLALITNSHLFDSEIGISLEYAKIS